MSTMHKPERPGENVWPLYFMTESSGLIPLTTETQPADLVTNYLLTIALRAALHALKFVPANLVAHDQIDWTDFEHRCFLLITQRVSCMDVVNKNRSRRFFEPEIPS